MNYRNFLKQSYAITLNNPILWMFGLFLSGGFNLNLLYLIALFRGKPNSVLEFVQSMANGTAWWNIAAVVLVGIVGLLVTNWLKTVFIVEAHGHLHDSSITSCALCIKNKDHPEWRARLPKLGVVAQVLMASLITLGVTVVLAIPLNHLITHNAQTTSPIGFSVTMLASLILFCMVSCWNMFTALYIIFHHMRLQVAAKAAMDLIVLRAKNVFEYTLLLLIVYGALVVVGSVLIILSQFSIAALSSPFHSWPQITSYVSTMVQIIGTVGFWVWLAISNVFFNICLIIFFDYLVKPVSKEKPVEALPATPAVS